MSAPAILKVFEAKSDDDFASYNAATSWLESLGYCVGSMQRGAPTAAYIDPDGDGCVSKWRNLGEDEKDAVDAMIHDMGRGRFRGGSVEVVVYSLSPAMEAWAAELNS